MSKRTAPKRLTFVLSAADQRKDYLFDLVLTLLLATGCVVALFDMLGFETALWYPCAMVAADLLLIAVAAKWWWSAPAALALGTGGVFLFAWLNKSVPALLDYWAGFGQWIRAGLPELEPYSHDGSLALTALLAALPLTLLFYLFVRRFFSFWAVLVFVVGAVAGLEFLSNKSVVPALCLLLAGLILALPAALSRRVNAGKEGGQVIARHSMQLLAVPIAFVCVLSAWDVTPRNDGEWKNEGLNLLVSDIGDFVQSFNGEGESAGGSDHSLRYSGYQPLGDRLGGDVELRHAKVLEVTTGAPIYLAGSVQDTYDGRAWSDGYGNGRFRYGSLFWRGQRQWAFQTGLPVAGSRALIDAVTLTTHMQISTSVHKLNTLFASGMISDVQVMYPKMGNAYFNLQSELFSTYEGANTYTFTTTVYDWTKPDFARNMLELEREVDGKYDRYYAEIAGRYTGLPDTLPASVRTLTGEITAESASPFARALAIRSWLAENCTYTLTPGQPPEDEDFVAHFLETREGYCVYYASAMAVMGRCAGLPTRYMTGYGLRSENGRLFATQATAHAWCEVYFEGIGWVVFDPLGVQDTTDLQTQTTAPQTAAPQTPPPIDPIDWQELVQEQIMGEQQEVRLGSGASFTPLVVALLLAVLAVGAALFVRRRMTRYLRLYEAQAVLFHELSSEKAVDYIYADLLRQLRYYDIQPNGGETLARFAARVDAYFVPEATRMEQVADVVSRERYALRKLTPQDVEVLAAFHADRERGLRKYLGNFRYFWRRALFGGGKKAKKSKG